MQTVKGSTSIVLMGRAEQMLAEATTVQKAKELKDLALTAKDWAKRKGLGEAVVQKATLYSRLAKDRLGQLLIETKEKRAKGRGRAVKGKKHFQQRLPAGIAVEDEPTLAQLGVTPKESKESQDIAKRAAKPGRVRPLGRGTFLQLVAFLP